MLRARHEDRRYPRLTFGAKPAALDVSPLGRARPDACSPESSELPTLRDLHELTFEEFEERYLDTRDSLAYKRLLGEALSERERASLELMNLWLDQHLPTRSTTPDDVKESVAELLRRVS